MGLQGHTFSSQALKSWQHWSPSSSSNTELGTQAAGVSGTAGMWDRVALSTTSISKDNHPCHLHSKQALQMPAALRV